MFDKTKWQPVSLRYNFKTNTVYIDAPKSAFVPEYLKYMLAYLKIPTNAKCIFQPEPENKNQMR